MRALVLLLTLLASPIWAQTESIVADLSQSRVAITTTFTGSEILVFGAIKRDTPSDALNPPHVIVTISGPSAPIVVRKKERIAGIWVNADEARIDRAPSFYAVATTGPLTTVLSHTEDLRHRVSKHRAIRFVGEAKRGDPRHFQEALIRIREDDGAYTLEEGTVAFFDDTLFRTSVGLPANLVEGAYTVRIFLTRNRNVVSTYETTISVRKVGLERFLYNLAQERPLIYGLMSLAIAIAAGWLASAAFQIFRR